MFATLLRKLVIAVSLFVLCTGAIVSFPASAKATGFVASQGFFKNAATAVSQKVLGVASPRNSTYLAELIAEAVETPDVKTDTTEEAEELAKAEAKKLKAEKKAQEKAAKEEAKKAKELESEKASAE